jgi:transposase
MPLDQVIINLPFFKILSITGHSYLRIEAICLKKAKCLYCSSQNLRKKDKFIRKVRHISLGNRLSELHLHSHKFQCKDCKRYFNQRFEGILPRKRSSEQFRMEVSRDHHDGITQYRLSKKFRLSCSTVEKWYQDLICIENKKLDGASVPKVLGIDEHFFTKKKGYATTFANLGKNKVFDVCLGRSQKSLDTYLRKLKGKENTQVILMDLSETYRSIAKKYFKNAMIVADRFHVVRLINHHFMNVWKKLDPDGKYNRGLLSLIRRHEWNLKEDQKIKLDCYLERIVGLKSVYQFKQSLIKLTLLKHLKAQEARKYIPVFLKMIEMLKSSGFEDMVKLGKTLDSWKEEIARMWRFTKTNSITEGLHNKMEMLSRRAFGFRNFNNYRLRVRVHCGYVWE